MSGLVNQSVGEYRLVDFIGAGGMGEVYRAVHRRLGRVVAVKVLTQAQDPAALQRFFNEARIQAELRHPGIATLHDFLEFHGRPCIVMEFVDGQTLFERIHQQGRLRPEEAASILERMAEAVGYIHSRGFVHRDLKSNNVKITSSGEVRLLDFGIARSLRAAHVTKTGMVVGTLENLSPEQIQGLEADARADIWALGVVLYEALTGRLPFEASHPVELYGKILHTEPAPASQLNPAVPPSLEAVIVRCLKKKPAERYPSTEALRRDLGAPPGQVERVPLKLPSVGKLAAIPRIPSVGWKAPAGILAALAAAILLWLAVGLFSGGNGSSQAGARKSIAIDVIGGTAQVYRDGRRLGSTPYNLKARTGDRVDLTLKREGYQDLPVQFEVSERGSYSYTMEPARD